MIIDKKILFCCIIYLRNFIIFPNYIYTLFLFRKFNKRLRSTSLTENDFDS